MISITCFGGVGEVGGNKILLEDEDTKIFLDFGKSFGREKQYYQEPYLKPREEKHLLNLGLLPEMDGLYKDEKEPPVDAVLVSHPHLDHWGYACFLDNQIPIYCGEASRDIITNYEFCSKTAPSSDYYIANLTKKRGREIFKDFRAFRTGDRVTIGSVEIRPIHVDHSIPGSYGFIIHTSDGVIIYTGDLRLRGTRGHMTEEFITEAERHEPKLMITEATNVTGATPSSENEVEKKVKHLVESCSGLVVATFSSRDADRLRTFYRSAKENGRKLAISMKQAFLLRTLAKDPHIDIFDLQDPDIVVFRRDKERIDAWEEDILAVKEPHYSPDINEIQGEAILVASLYDMNEFGDIDPSAGSIFILSQSEPFDEEGEIRHEKLLSWCEHYGMPQYQVHTSGHMMPHELKSAVDRVGPLKVVPVHTETPGQLKKYISDLDCEVVLPDLGEKISAQV